MADALPTGASVLDELHAKFGVRGLERIEQALTIYDSGEVPPLPDKQYSQALYVPGLTAKPWHEAKDFAWWTPFEDATPEVLRELAIVEKADVGYTDWAGYGQGWTGRAFYQQGAWQEATCALAPVTTALLRSTRYTQGDFLYSVIKGGGFIGHHSGQCNAILSTHLALIIPPGCLIEVGGVKREWQVGKCLAFDDSFAHAVWNTSSQRRVCLVWEVWHPELTDLECAAMAIAYQKLVNDLPDEDEADEG